VVRSVLVVALNLDIGRHRRSLPRPQFETSVACVT